METDELWVWVTLCVIKNVLEIGSGNGDITAYNNNH